MKKFVAVALSLIALAFAGAVGAQTCDLNMNMSAAFAGASTPDQVTTAAYHNITPAEAQDIAKRSLKVVDTLSKVQDKKGAYTVTLGGDTNCPGVQVAAIEAQQVTLQGVAQIYRSAFQVAEGTIRGSEQKHAKGKKRAWGPE